ncbi:MAG: hypothetical protein HYY26_02460 [Acidobacteria bacterium]|nr:hypothetical protein [Acidobacteriota bacterium]
MPSEKKANGGAATRGSPVPGDIPVAQREPDAVYQRDRQGQLRPVGRVADVEVDEQGKEILFGEVSHSDDLLLSDEFEYQNYLCLVRKIAFAVKEDKSDARRGRVLRGVTAEILGRVEH